MRSLVHGTVVASSSVPLHVRLKEIFDSLNEVVREYAPSVMAVEDVFTGKGHRTSMKIGEGRGVVLLCAAVNDLEVHEYPPARVKQAVTGNGRASKEQVRAMVARVLGMKSVEGTFDAADALAVAVCCCNDVGKWL